MIESVTIVLPLPNRVLEPNCAVGSLGGRFMKAAATKKYRRIACEAVEAEAVESMPWKHVIVKVAFYHKMKRRHDQDNAMGSLKAAYDGIRDSGLVQDDDYEHMHRDPPTFEIDKKSPRVELTISRD
jgi:Holliday junction resolvase RusA-like endonuclease